MCFCCSFEFWGMFGVDCGARISYKGMLFYFSCFYGMMYAYGFYSYVRVLLPLYYSSRFSFNSSLNFVKVY